jgi:predicted RNA-binding Zn ribbon-like protein
MATDEIRDGFKFRGGALALDLPATLAGRISGNLRENLQAPADLDRWLVAAGLAAAAPEATPEDLADALVLREALYALALARAEHRSLPDADRGVLNAFAAEPSAPPWLDGEGRRRLFGEAKALLAGLAREGVELLGGEQSGRIRQCQGPPCAVLFVDTSRKGDRRWCSMSACGNKAKVAEFRRREKLAEG